MARTINQLKDAQGKPSESRAAKQKLYNSKAWRRLRLLVLAEQPLCVQCLRTGRTVPATVVDHKRPHGGNLTMFWKLSNLQGLCRGCHNRKSRAEQG